MENVLLVPGADNNLLRKDLQEKNRGYTTRKKNDN